MGLYDKCVRAFGWDLESIENTDFEILMKFAGYKDPNVRTIKGKQYRRAQGVPKWL